MVNTLYTQGRSAILRAQVDWLNADVKFTAIDTSQYTADIANDEFMSSVPVAARIATEDVTARTVTNGVADCEDIIFPAIAAGSTIDGGIFWINTGVDATSRLIAYVDQSTAFPYATNGGGFRVLISNGMNRLFQI